MSNILEKYLKVEKLAITLATLKIKLTVARLYSHDYPIRAYHPGNI